MLKSSKNPTIQLKNLQLSQKILQELEKESNNITNLDQQNQIKRIIQISLNSIALLKNISNQNSQDKSKFPNGIDIHLSKSLLEGKQKKKLEIVEKILKNQVDDDQLSKTHVANLYYNDYLNVSTTFLVSISLSLGLNFIKISSSFGKVSKLYWSPFLEKSFILDFLKKRFEMCDLWL